MRFSVAQQLSKERSQEFPALVIYKPGLEREETVPEWGIHQLEQSLQQVMQVNNYTVPVSKKRAKCKLSTEKKKAHNSSNQPYLSV